MNEQHKQNGASPAIAGLPEELLTAYGLGQLAGDERAAERAAVERHLAAADPADARQIVAETRRLAEALPAALAGNQESIKPNPALREAIMARLNDQTDGLNPPADNQPKVELGQRRRWLGLTWVHWTLVGGLACVAVVLLQPAIQSSRQAARHAASQRMDEMDSQFKSVTSTQRLLSTRPANSEPNAAGFEVATGQAGQSQGQGEAFLMEHVDGEANRLHDSIASDMETKGAAVAFGDQPLESAPRPNVVAVEVDSLSTATTDFSARVAESMPLGETQAYGGRLQTPESKRHSQLGEMQLGGMPLSKGYLHDGGQHDNSTRSDGRSLTLTPQIILQEEEEARLGFVDSVSVEQYAAISDNPFVTPRQQPLSTFSIDVDTASYANVRRFLTGGSLPPPDAVRIEELVNYFRYDYPQPKDGEAFSVNMETAECPWHNGHLLLRVGLKGKDVARTERPQSNLVFLLDVSGSMADEDKLPLLKTSLEMFTRELGENDRVSIVTYAGEAGLRLPPTRGHEPEKIIAAIQSLTSGGSTNGSAGIEIAYEQAAAYFVKGGTNRVILCTDGDLNVGITDDEALVELIKKKAAGGTFLTVLGFGQGNLKDAKMERLADNGNGLYAYIDSLREARKVLVEQMTGSTIAIAKDVKIQIEFNPAAVASYRLIGYENRVLAAQDFNDDTKDAGEIGAGHTVTALYELVPVGAEPAAKPAARTDPLKYQATGDREQEAGDRSQEPATKLTDAAKSGELLTLKLRYKQPDGNESKLIEHPLKERGGRFNAASKDLQFAASVASFGMILRNSEHRGSGNLAAVAEIASGSLGEDAGGYRAEFVDLVRKAQSLGAK